MNTPEESCLATRSSESVKNAEVVANIFFLFTDELADITFGESFRLILQIMFESIYTIFNATNDQIDAFIDIFLDRLTVYMKNALAKSAVFAA